MSMKNIKEKDVKVRRIEFRPGETSLPSLAAEFGTKNAVPPEKFPPSGAFIVQVYSVYTVTVEMVDFLPAAGVLSA